ncbi:hypothetical protein [Sphingomonas ginkgonis]|nr:hypothetical protein [Sphingomonas ginkgonis]
MASSPDRDEPVVPRRRSGAEGAGDQRLHFANRANESASACHENAAADRQRAAAAETAHARERYEGSALQWDRRAALLTRLEQNFYARQQERELVAPAAERNGDAVANPSMIGEVDEPSPAVEHDPSGGHGEMPGNGHRHLDL